MERNQSQQRPATDVAARRTSLFAHVPHPHVPRNPNELHAQEQAAAGVNTRLAVWLTQHVGTMACAYLFAAIGIGGLVGAFTGNVFLALLFGSISSYFLQLVLLPILAVGSNVLSRKQELQADEMFATTQKSFHDIEQIMTHLSSQDEELLRQTRLLLDLAGQGQQQGELVRQLGQLAQDVGGLRQEIADKLAAPLPVVVAAGSHLPPVCPTCGQATPEGPR